MNVLTEDVDVSLLKAVPSVDVTAVLVVAMGLEGVTNLTGKSEAALANGDGGGGKGTLDQPP